MTVKQLLKWCLDAYDKHNASYDVNTDRYLICKQQSIIQTEPKRITHGYFPDDGTFQLALELIFSQSKDDLESFYFQCEDDTVVMAAQHTPPTCDTVDTFIPLYMTPAPGPNWTPPTNTIDMTAYYGLHQTDDEIDNIMTPQTPF